MLTPRQLIQRFYLQPHPEGGWYKEVYRSREFISSKALPARYSGDRNFCTFIYFLLEQGEFSAFHLIKSDECWHFYAGDPMQVYILENDGELTVIELGNDIEKGQVFQYVVPANHWFASRPSPGSSFSFVGCTVAPGFEFADFELADATNLSKQFPKHAGLIRQLCL
ncbi:MAG TPA: cupin domain-containing protein [Chitinophagaceae bacterium]